MATTITRRSSEGERRMGGLNNVARAIAPGGTLIRDPVGHYIRIADELRRENEKLRHMLVMSDRLAVRIAFEQWNKRGELERAIVDLRAIVDEFKEKFARFGRTYGGIGKT